MRMFGCAVTAFDEIARDLKEMGIEVRPKTMQDKLVEGNPDYYTKELQNYSYMLLDAKAKEIPSVSQPWADEEFKERIHLPKVISCSKCEEELSLCNPLTCELEYINPGEAYKLRPEVWDEFLQRNGKFAYSYNERLYQADQLSKIIYRIKKDPDSRQLWLSLWNPETDIDNLGGVSRVPCSLGYNFQIRNGKINMHYIMRSCDFSTHFKNDVFLAIRLLEWVAMQTGYEVGNFTHTIFSLHVYNKDVRGVF